jgi:hypothetical protein
MVGIHAFPSSPHPAHTGADTDACHHLTQWLCQKGWSAAVAYLLAKVLLILVTTLSH